MALVTHWLPGRDKSSSTGLYVHSYLTIRRVSFSFLDHDQVFTAIGSAFSQQHLRWMLDQDLKMQKKPWDAAGVFATWKTLQAGLQRCFESGECSQKLLLLILRAFWLRCTEAHERCKPSVSLR